MEERNKSRKLWYFSICGIVFTAMQIGGYLPVDGVVYAQLMIGTMVAFAGGNVGEHFAKRA